MRRFVDHHLPFIVALASLLGIYLVVHLGSRTL